MSAILIKLCYNYIRYRKKDSILSKINVVATLNGEGTNHVVKTKGILKNHVLVYSEDQVKVRIQFGDEILLVRENSEYCLTLLFALDQKKEGSYLLKQYSKMLPIEIKTILLKCTDNKLDVQYELSLDGIWKRYQFQVEYEVIE